MKAVIMAGGKGSRLRPVTNGIPKPLCTLLGKPVIFHILDLLYRNGVTEARVALGYQGDILRQALASYTKIPLSFSMEDTPLGTAGSVRKAAGEWTDDFIVISGDALCDFDLKAACRFHRESGAAATLLASRVDDPREYGLICTGRDGRVVSFVEKPSYSGCVTDLANTGVYILSPTVLHFIPQGETVDFAADIFPELLRRQMPVYAYTDHGYWCDVGDIRSYIRCQHDMLKGKAKFEVPAVRMNGNYFKGRISTGHFTIYPPVYIGKSVSIGEGSVIGPDTILEDHVQIGSGCRISGSVLMEGAAVENQVTLQSMAACPFSRFENGAEAFAGSAVGKGAVLGENSMVLEGCRIWDGKKVGQGETLSEDLQERSEGPLFIGENGFSGETNRTITPEICLKIGRGTAGLSERPSVGIGWTGLGGGAAFADACAAGLMASGAKAWNFGKCVFSQFQFCLAKSRADFGIYIAAEDSGTSIRIVERCGMPLRRSYERKIEGAVNRSEFRCVPAKDMGAHTPMENVAVLYPYELMKLCRTPLTGMAVRVSSPSEEARLLLLNTLRQLGCEEGDGIKIHISSDGSRISLGQGDCSMPPERVLAAACFTEFLKGGIAVLPENAPTAIDTLAGNLGGKVLRYPEDSASDRTSEACRAAAVQPLFRDGMMMAVRLLSFLTQKGMRLEELDKQIPAFYIKNKMISVSISPGIVLQRMKQAGWMDETGTEFYDGVRRARLRPLKDGKGILLSAENPVSETAEEICGHLERLIGKAALDTGPIS